MAVPDHDGGAGVRARRARSPNLDRTRVAAIAALAARLEGKPDWACLLEAVERELGHAYTRQALSAHSAVRLALAERRRGAPPRPGSRARSTVLQSARESADRLRRENETLRRSYEAVLLELQRCTYNAHAHDVSLRQLAEPLPIIDRT